MRIEDLDRPLQSPDDEALVRRYLEYQQILEHEAEERKKRELEEIERVQRFLWDFHHHCNIHSQQVA